MEIRRADGMGPDGRPIMSPLSSDYTDVEVTAPARPTSPIAEERYRDATIGHLMLEEAYWASKGDVVNAGEVSLQMEYYRLLWAGVLQDDIMFLPTRPAVDDDELEKFREQQGAPDEDVVMVAA